MFSVAMNIFSLMLIDFYEMWWLGDKNQEHWNWTVFDSLNKLIKSEPNNRGNRKEVTSLYVLNCSIDIQNRMTACTNFSFQWLFKQSGH